MLPLEGIIGSAILILLVLEATRRTAGGVLVGDHPRALRSMSSSARICRAISPPATVTPQRLLVYLGLDVNSA